MLKKLIKVLGGFTKDEVLTEAVKELFNTINSDDILNTEGDWTVGGKPIIEGEKKLLVAEAKSLLDSKLYKYLKKDIQYKANKAMFEKAKTQDDLVAGKLWLYTLDCIETFLNKLTNP